MPRVAGVFDWPPGIYPQSPNTTIESGDWNKLLEEMKADANAARPLIAGGTGAANGADARTNLQAERANAQVTNYGSHVFESGSFWSAPGATDAPEATEYYAGTAINVNNDPGAWVIRAVGLTSGKAYTRHKQAGAWTTWSAGQTLVGNITIDKANPALILDKPASGTDALVVGRTATKNRWMIMLGDAQAETGGNAGSDFVVHRFNDAGDYLGTPLYIDREGGAVTIDNPTQTSLLLTTGATGVTQIILKESGNLKGLFDYVSAGFGGGSANTVRVGSLGGGAPLLFLTDSAERMRIAADGNVAIGGVVNTLYKLAVYGSLWASEVVASGNLYSGGTLTIASGNIGSPTNLHLQPTGLLIACYNGTAAFKFGVYNGVNPQFYVDAEVGLSYHIGNISFGTATAHGEKVWVEGNAFVTDALFVGNQLRSQRNGDNYIWLNNGAGANYGLIGYEQGFDRLRFSRIGVADLSLDSLGIVWAAKSIKCKEGLDGAYGTNSFNFNWTGSALAAWVDNVNLGNVSVTSDYRVKANVADLPSTWNAVKALRPVSFHYKDYGTTFLGSADPQWGFIAHELQDTLLPTAATGTKDDPGIIQSPNLFAVLAAVTKALQETMARVEALENA